MIKEEFNTWMKNNISFDIDKEEEELILKLKELLNNINSINNKPKHLLKIQQIKKNKQD